MEPCYDEEADKTAELPSADYDHATRPTPAELKKGGAERHTHDTITSGTTGYQLQLVHHKGTNNIGRGLQSASVHIPICQLMHVLKFWIDLRKDF